MEIHSSFEYPSLRVQFSGRSTFSDYKHVERLCRQLEQMSDNVMHLEIDLSGLEFIDSAGLGMLLLLKENCDRCNVGLKLISPVGQVKKMLEVSRLTELFGLPPAV